MNNKIMTRKFTSVFKILIITLVLYVYYSIQSVSYAQSIAVTDDDAYTADP